MRPLHFGITGGARPWLPELARALTDAGYMGAWANDTPGHAALDALRGLAAGEARLALGIGVVSLSDHDPAEVAVAIRAVALPADRLILGLGSGRSASVSLVRDGIAALRGALPGVRLAVAALGPRMCELGGEVADLVLLNWAAPARVAWARERIAAGAARSGRPMPVVAGYVRVAVGEGADERLRAELERYAAAPAYRRAFEAQAGIPGVAAAAATGARAQLAPYRAALDVCVVRALPAGDRLVDWLAVARAVADL